MAPHERAREQVAPTVAQRAPARGAETARQPPFAALQRLAGNQAVAQLVTSPGATMAADPRARVDQLQLAIRMEAFPRPMLRIDLDRAVEALTDLTREDGQAIKAEYKRRTGWTLGWVITGRQDLGDGTLATSLAKAEQTRLLNLLGGTVASPTDPGQAQAASALVGDLVTGAASLLGGDQASAAALGERAAGAAMAASEASDQQRAAAAEASRYRAEAAQVRRALERKQAEVALGLIRRPFAERQALASQYATLYGESIYNALTTRLSGRDAQRAAAIWTDDDMTADRLALEGDLERQAKVEADTKGAEELAEALPSVAEVIKSRRRAARTAVEARLEGIATAEQPDTASGRAAGREHLAQVLAGSTGSGATLDARVRATGDRVTTAIIDRGEPEEMAARMARADAEGTLTARDLEAALRQLRVLARKAALREIEHQPAALGPQAANVLQVITDGYYQRFQRHFDQVATKRTLTEALTIGSDVEEARDRALFAEHGTLPPWRELDLALRRSPKDMDRVRLILDGMTHQDVADVEAAYSANTKPQRSLRTDLLGTDVEQRMASFIDRDKAAADLAEKQVLLQGGTFSSTSTDEATQLDEERRWLFGRFVALERGVIENSGTFAEVRDWLGNLERDLVDRAHADAADASSAMAKALTDSPPDLAAARAGLVELRRATARIERNLAVYKEATKAAFDEFVDLAVLAVTTIISAGQGTAIMMAIRTTVATIGTKAALKGSDYSLDEFLMDLRSGLGAAAGGKLVEGVLEPVAKQVATYVGTTRLSKGFAGTVLPQLGKAGMWEAENLITTATGNVATGQDISSGMGLEAHADNLIQEGVTAGIRGMRGGPDRGGGSQEGHVPGADERPTRSTSEEAGPVRTTDTMTPRPVGTEVAGGAAEGGPVTEAGTLTSDDPATEPRVSMQLPEDRAGARPREADREASRQGPDDEASTEPPEVATDGDDFGGDTDTDIEVPLPERQQHERQEQERRAREYPRDRAAVERSTAPNARARALAKELAPIHADWPDLSPEQRRSRLEEVMNRSLAAAGVPRVVLLGGEHSPGEAAFSPYTWRVTVSIELLMDPVITPARFAMLADNIAHEGRHALHHFRGLRMMDENGLRIMTSDRPAEVAIRAALEANRGWRHAEQLDVFSPKMLEAQDVFQQTFGSGAEHRAAVIATQKSAARRYEAAASALATETPGTPAHAAALEAAQAAAQRAHEAHNDYMALPQETDAWRRGLGTRSAMLQELQAQQVRSLFEARRRADRELRRARAAVAHAEATGTDPTRARAHEADVRRAYVEVDELLMGARRELRELQDATSGETLRTEERERRRQRARARRAAGAST